MRKNRGQICVVAIGMEHFVLPMADGLKLVDIMAKAERVRSDYGRRKKWVLQAPSEVDRVELELVRAEDIEFPAPAPVRLALPGASS